MGHCSTQMKVIHLGRKQLGVGVVGLRGVSFILTECHLVLQVGGCIE